MSQTFNPFSDENEEDILNIQSISPAGSQQPVTDNVLSLNDFENIDLSNTLGSIGKPNSSQHNSGLRTPVTENDNLPSLDGIEKFNLLDMNSNDLKDAFDFKGVPYPFDELQGAEHDTIGNYLQQQAQSPQQAQVQQQAQSPQQAQLQQQAQSPQQAQLQQQAQSPLQFQSPQQFQSAQDYDQGNDVYMQQQHIGPSKVFDYQDPTFDTAYREPPLLIPAERFPQLYAAIQRAPYRRSARNTRSSLALLDRNRPRKTRYKATRDADNNVLLEPVTLLEEGTRLSDDYLLSFFSGNARQNDVSDTDQNISFITGVNANVDRPPDQSTNRKYQRSRTSYQLPHSWQSPNHRDEVVKMFGNSVHYFATMHGALIATIPTALLSQAMKIKFRDMKGTRKYDARHYLKDGPLQHILTSTNPKKQERARMARSLHSALTRAREKSMIEEWDGFPLVAVDVELPDEWRSVSEQHDFDNVHEQGNAFREKWEQRWQMPWTLASQRMYNNNFNKHDIALLCYSNVSGYASRGVPDLLSLTGTTAQHLVTQAENFAEDMANLMGVCIARTVFFSNLARASVYKSQQSILSGMTHGNLAMIDFFLYDVSNPKWAKILLLATINHIAKLKRKRAPRYSMILIPECAPTTMVLKNIFPFIHKNSMGPFAIPELHDTQRYFTLYLDGKKNYSEESVDETTGRKKHNLYTHLEAIIKYIPTGQPEHHTICPSNPSIKGRCGVR